MCIWHMTLVHNNSISFDLQTDSAYSEHMSIENCSDSVVIATNVRLTRVCIIIIIIIIIITSAYDVCLYICSFVC